MATENDVTYGFNREQAMELVNGLGQRDFNVRLYEPQDTGGGGGSPLLHFVSRSGGIPARSGLQMGSATVDVYVSNSTGLLAADGEATVYNKSSNAFGGDRFGIANENDAGLWVAIFEDCEEADLPEPDPEPPPPEEEGPPPP
jgi:hypothetical protein